MNPGANMLARSAADDAALPLPGAAAPAGVLAEAGITLRVFHDLADVEALWRAFEPHAVASGYQRFDFAAAWQRHVGAAQGLSPRIMVGETRDGFPLFIWPLVLRRGRWAATLHWLGGKHANFAMGLYARGAAERLTPPVLDAALRMLGEQVPEAVALGLENQPASWAGMANPLRQLAHEPAANPAYFTVLGTDFESFVAARRSAKSRKRLRWQERKLADLGELRFARAQGVSDIDAVLNGFFAQKARRFTETGTRNVFDQPEVQTFLRDYAHGADGAHGPLELFGLWCGGRLIATYGGVSHGGRFSVWINSYALEPEFSRYSPAEVLLVHLIEHLMASGHDSFDLGTGEAAYKHQWLDQEAPLFASFIPLRPRGIAYVAIARRLYSLKRLIKMTPALWRMVELARGTRARLLPRD